MRVFILLLLIFVPLESWAGGANASKGELTIYTSQKEDFVKPIFAEFTKDSGINVKIVQDKGPVLIERLKAEGAKSPADLLITVDAGNLWLATKEDLLLTSESKVFDGAIPERYRDPKHRWIGLSIRARTLVYNPEKVQLAKGITYEDLAKPEWKGKLCLRTSRKVYNQSLVASLIHHHGEEKTEKVVRGWVNNLAAPVFSSDTLLLKAIESGECAVGISNSYYLARLVQKDPKFNVKLHWANQNDRGTHVNVAGAGVVKVSQKKALAKIFLEWAVQPKAQGLFANSNFEFPIVDSAERNEIVKDWC